MNAGFDLCRARQIPTYRTFGAMIAMNDARTYLGSYGERQTLGTTPMSGDGPKRLLVALAIGLVTGILLAGTRRRAA